MWDLLVALLVATSLRMVQQYQRGVVLRFGRLLPQVRQPGLRLLAPVADRMVKVPVQTIVLDAVRVTTGRAVVLGLCLQLSAYTRGASSLRSVVDPDDREQSVP